MKIKRTTNGVNVRMNNDEFAFLVEFMRTENQGYLQTLEESKNDPNSDEENVEWINKMIAFTASFK